MAENTGNEGGDSQVLSITVDRPEAGETQTISVVPGLRVVLEFNPAAARVTVEGDDFILTLDDSAQVVLAGLVSAAQDGDAPTIHTVGINIDAQVIVEQALALTEDEAEPIETAAGEDGEEDVGDGGSSHYDDTFGDLIAGLIKQGIIGETELGFGLTGSSGTELPVDAESLSEGYLLDDDRFSSSSPSSSSGFGLEGVPSPASFDPGISGGPDPVSAVAPAGGSGAVGASVPGAAAAVSTPTVSLSGSFKEDTANDVTIDAAVGDSTDQLTSVAIAGLTWGVVQSELDDLEALADVSGATFAGGTLTITLVAGVESFSYSTLTLTPPADTDLDLSGLQITANVADKIDNTVTGSDNDTVTFVVDAVADAGSFVNSSGIAASVSGSPVDLNLTLTPRDAVNGTPDGGPHNNAGGIDNDGSEAVTTITVTLSGAGVTDDTDAALLFDAAGLGSIASSHTGGSLVWTFTGTEADHASLVATFQVDPSNSFVGTVDVQVDVLTAEVTTSGGEPDLSDNTVTESFNFQVTAAAGPPASFLQGAFILSLDTGSPIFPNDPVFQDADLVSFHPGTNTTGVFVDKADIFKGNDENIDALHVLDDGRVLFSTESMVVNLNPDPSINPGTGEGDLFIYDPTDNSVTQFESPGAGGAFFDIPFTDLDGVTPKSESIDAIWFEPTTNSIVLSIEGGPIMLGGVQFDGGELIQWDGTTATMIFDANLHFDGQGNVFEAASADIDAFHVTDYSINNGTIVLNEIVVSTTGDVKDSGGDVLFGPDDLFTFNVGTDTATLFFDAGTDVNSFSLADILDASDLLVTVDENNGIAEAGEFDPDGDPGTDPNADIDNFVKFQADAGGANILVDADGAVGGQNFVSIGYVSGLAVGDTINVIVDELGNSEAVTVI